jgi:hypothetical protein
MRMKKGMQTETSVTGNRQSVAEMSNVVIPKTPCTHLLD